MRFHVKFWVRFTKTRSVFQQSNMGNPPFKWIIFPAIDFKLNGSLNCHVWLPEGIFLRYFWEGRQDAFRCGPKDGVDSFKGPYYPINIVNYRHPWTSMSWNARMFFKHCPSESRILCAHISQITSYLSCEAWATTRVSSTYSWWWVRFITNSLCGPFGTRNLDHLRPGFRYQPSNFPG